MADDFVSLNEITSIKGDADLAYGTQGVGGNDTVLPFSKGIELLSRAAELKQQNDRWKYEQFKNNINDYYKTFNDLDVNGVMEKDYPSIVSDYSSLAKTMADNIGVIRNPASNPETFAMLKQKEAMLRGKIAQSKQDLAYRDKVKSIFDRNPDWLNEQNKQKFNDFTNGELGNRMYDLPTPPEVYDITKHAAIANDIATNQLEEMKRVNGAYIQDKGESVVLKDLYDKAFMQLGANQDASGRTWKSLAVNSLKAIKQIQDGASDEQINEAIKKAGDNLIRADKRYSKLIPDQPEMQSQQISAQRELENKKLQFQDKWQKMDDATKRYGIENSRSFEKWKLGFSAGLLDLDNNKITRIPDNTFGEETFKELSGNSVPFDKNGELNFSQLPNSRAIILGNEIQLGKEDNREAPTKIKRIYNPKEGRYSFQLIDSKGSVIESYYSPNDFQHRRDKVDGVLFSGKDEIQFNEKKSYPSAQTKTIYKNGILTTVTE